MQVRLSAHLLWRWTLKSLFVNTEWLRRRGRCCVACLGMFVNVCMKSVSLVADILCESLFARCWAAKHHLYCKTWQLTARLGWTQTLSVSVSPFKCSISWIFCGALGLFHAEVVYCLASCTACGFTDGKLEIYNSDIKHSLLCLILTLA